MLRCSELRVRCETSGAAAPAPTARTPRRQSGTRTGYARGHLGRRAGGRSISTPVVGAALSPVDDVGPAVETVIEPEARGADLIDVHRRAHEARPPLEPSGRIARQRAGGDLGS